MPKLFSKSFFTRKRVWVLLLLMVIIACTPLPFGRTEKTLLLSAPFLQLPTDNSVRVVWFTEFAGQRHTVAYGEGLSSTVTATTTKLSRIREDQNSRVEKQTQDGQIYKKPTERKIWRHEALVTGLTPGIRVNYRVISVREDGTRVSSNVWRC